MNRGRDVKRERKLAIAYEANSEGRPLLGSLIAFRHPQDPLYVGRVVRHNDTGTGSIVYGPDGAPWLVWHTEIKEVRNEA